MREPSLGTRHTFTALVGRLEHMLRIDESMGTGDRIRARLVYGIALLVVALQVPNMIGLLLTFGHLNSQFAVSMMSCVLLLGLVASLRRWRNWQVCGALFGAILLGAVVTVTLLLDDSVLAGGINSSLLPMIVMGPIVVGLVANWKVVAGYTVAAVGVLAWQHGISAEIVSGLAAGSVVALDPAGSGAYVLESLGINQSQRLMQTSIALFVSAGLSAWFGSLLYATLDTLDETVDSAQRAEATKGDFLAQMSHEIRTPLNGIVAMSDLLADGQLPSHAQRPAEIIATASQQLVTIIDEILDSARLEAGRLVLVHESFDLRAEMESVLEIHRARADEKGLWLGLVWSDDLPTHFKGDGNRIRQVVGNFVSNAIKFTERGGVRVEVSGEDDLSGRQNLTIRVQDTGVGIAHDEIDSVFERYKQSASGRRQGTKGTGLGLAIAKELAELMDGRVGVQSLLGQGTAFHITLALPVCETPARPGVVAKAA